MLTKPTTKTPGSFGGHCQAFVSPTQGWGIQLSVSGVDFFVVVRISEINSPFSISFIVYPKISEVIY